MDRRRLLIIVGAAVLLLVAVILWLVLRGGSSTPPPVGVTPTSTSEDNLSLPPQPTEPTTPQPDQTGAVVAARVWAERFASWSNEDDFTNLQQLDGQSTNQVKAFLITYRQQLQQRYPLADGYRGVTGRALSPRLDSYDAGAGTAQVSIAMQLAESTSTVPTITNRVLDLRLLRNGEAWLVDFVKWAD
jgi:hypothetical protein